jgi:hypothetical protein
VHPLLAASSAAPALRHCQPVIHKDELRLLELAPLLPTPLLGQGAPISLRGRRPRRPRPAGRLLLLLLVRVV